MKNEKKKVIIEKDFHRTAGQRILHILCLLIPIAGAFAGYFITPKESSETIKLLISLIGFSIPTIIIFILTRKENPIMKIILRDALVLTD